MRTTLNTLRRLLGACLMASALTLNLFAQTLTNGLIFYAPFNGSLNDVTGGRTGNGFNAPALNLSGGVGNGAYVTLANDATSPKQAVWYSDPTPASNDFSFQIWVRTADSSSAQNGQAEPDVAIASNKDWGSGANVGWVLARQDGAQGEQFQWNINTANGARKDLDLRSPSATVFDGAWHQMLVTYQRNGNATFYIDGTTIGSVAISANAGNMRPSLGTWITNNILALGEDATLQYWHGSGAALNGDLDEAAMWDRALTASEVITAYVKGTNGMAITGGPLSPRFIVQPKGGTRFASDNFALSAVVASDRAPLTYQWYKDVAPISGATSASLLLTNLESATATYTLVATDASGSITSAPAALTVRSSSSILDGLSVYLNFDNNISGQSGTTVNGTAIGADPAPKFTSGQVGTGAAFNNDASASAFASDWAVSLGDIESIYSNNWSFSFWVNLTNNLQGGLLGNKDWTSGNNVGWVCSPYNSQELNFRAEGGPRRDIGNVNVRDGQWHHVAGMFNRDANKVDLYVDGTFTVAGGLGNTGWESLTPAAFAPNDTLVGSSGSGAYAGAGAVDDLGIWTRLITPDEILSIYAQGKEAKPLPTAVAGSAIRPSISSQPQSVSLYEGRRLDLAVSAAGTLPLTYQWYKNGTAIGLATNNNFRVAAASAADAGTYTVVVSNSFGSVTSAPPAVVSVQPITSAATGLAVYLDFNSNITAQGGTTNNGTSIGNQATPVYAPGRIGNAAFFNNDGTGGLSPSDWAVSLGDVEWLYAKSWSFALWVKATNANDGALIGNKDWDTGANVGWLFVPTRANSLNYNVLGGTRRDIGGPTTIDGNWHHVAAIFDREANLVSYFIDGNLAVTNSIGATGLESLTPANVTPNDTLIGSSGPGRWAGAGNVDDVGLWQRPLSSEEVLAIYVQGLNGQPLTTASAGAIRPFVVTPPRSQERIEGMLASFTVHSAGTLPISYQWRKNGTDIPGSTNATLNYTASLSDSSAGFTVVVTNLYGAATSTPPAVLTVTPGPAALTNGLIVYLNFNSNILAQAGTTTSGTALGDVGMETYAPGVIGAAAKFNNNNSDSPVVSDWAVSLGDIEWIYTNNFAFSLWVKTTDNYGALLGNKSWYSGNNIGWCISRYYVDWLDYRAVDSPRHDIGNFDWAEDNWHHVAAVFYRDANMVYTFVDGNLTAQATLGTVGRESLTPEGIRQTLVGSSGDTTESAFGLVDDLGIWMRPITPAEVRMIYQSGLRGLAIPAATPSQPQISATISNGNIILTFPAWAADHVLEATTSLLSPSWAVVNATPVIQGENAVSTIPLQAGNRFFRLRN